MKRILILATLALLATFGTAYAGSAVENSKIMQTAADAFIAAKMCKGITIDMQKVMTMFEKNGVENDPEMNTHLMIAQAHDSISHYEFCETAKWLNLQ